MKIFAEELQALCIVIIKDYFVHDNNLLNYLEPPGLSELVDQVVPKRISESALRGRFSKLRSATPEPDFLLHLASDQHDSRWVDVYFEAFVRTDGAVVNVIEEVGDSISSRVGETKLTQCYRNLEINEICDGIVLHMCIQRKVLGNVLDRWLEYVIYKSNHFNSHLC